MTASDIITLARQGLDEVSNAHGLFSDANLLMWANMAERDIAAKTGCLEAVETTTTSIGARLIAISGDKVNDVELVVDGVGRSLSGAEIIWKDTEDDYLKYLNDVVYDYTEYSISVPYPPWLPLRITPHHLGHINLRGSTLPQYWFQWGSYVVIEPVASAVHTLNIYVSKSPSDQMTGGGSTPQIPIEFQEAIIPYVVMCGKMRQRYFNDAAIKYAEYLSTLQYLINKYKRRSPSRTVDIRLPDLVKKK